jgi:hypothetical protein
MGLLLFVWNKLFDFTLGLCFRYNRYYALVTLALVEIDGAVNQCIKSVILTNTYIVAWVVLCATLADDNVSSQNLLAAPDLNAKSLSC